MISIVCRLDRRRWRCRRGGECLSWMYRWSSSCLFFFVVVYGKSSRARLGGQSRFLQRKNAEREANTSLYTYAMGCCAAGM